MSKYSVALDDNNHQTWFPHKTTLRAGTTPSTSTLIAPFSGGNPPEAPREIEVKKGNRCVFSGKLASTRIVVNNDLTTLEATYSDFFSILENSEKIDYLLLLESTIIPVEGKRIIFNENAEGNRHRAENLFSFFIGDSCLWDAFGILEYLNKNCFCKYPNTMEFKLKTDELPIEVEERLKAFYPLHFNISDRSTSSVLKSLCEMCGVGIVVDFDCSIPEIKLFALPWDENESINLDAGARGSQLDMDDIPDILSYSISEILPNIPVSITLGGIRKELEVTLRTKEKTNESNNLEGCSRWEGDLIPDWTASEEGEYEMIYSIDPFEQATDLDNARAKLSHVYRKYRVNPNFAFRASFNSQGLTNKLRAIESFAYSELNSAVQPEVITRTDSKWGKLIDENLQVIGVRTLEYGMAFEFATQVSITDSVNANVIKVDQIAYSLCLTEEDADEITVSLSEVFPDSGSSKRKEYRTNQKLVRRICSPHLLRIHSRIKFERVRNDHEFARQKCVLEIEKCVNSKSGRAVLFGLRQDISPAVSLGNITFEKGIGGSATEPITINQRISKVILDPTTLTTEIFWDSML